MKLWSKDIENGEAIPKKFTADGKNINPHLAWDDVPENARSLALIMDDPDAPGGTFTHWLIGNMKPVPGKIKHGKVPKEANLARNDFGNLEYGGPSPPGGTHRYFFKLYALDTENIETADKKSFYRQVEEHKIDETRLMGLYSR